MGESPRLRAREVATLQLALDSPVIDLGVRLIDTAEMYANGGAEEVVGAALRGGRRDKAFVVTKVLPSNAGRRSAIAACERSLSRLAIDRIDLYLLHWRGTIPLAETVDAFEQLLHQGRIARWGVSNFDVADMRELSALKSGTHCAADQVYYSASHRGVEFDLLPWLQSHRMPLMAYCPFDEGRLLSERTLVAIGDKHGVSAAQVALAWLMTKTGVIAIPKASRTQHWLENAAAEELKLDAEDIARIDRRWPPPSSAHSLAVV
jgi:diketogulonate reductase-like aldo/keto reductase